MKKTLILGFFILQFFQMKGQGTSFWERNVNWDGVSPWEYYMIISPGYMGPNALPVPETRNALIDSNLYFQSKLESYFGFGDFTSNLNMKLYVPIAKNIAVESYIVPLEYYHLDSFTRNERHVRSEFPEGLSGGDFYFGTIIQILKDYGKIPDITLALSFKTASGLKLDDARFTDTPGYFFDLNFGKTIGNSRLSAMIGFYSWQTYSTLHRQNDAILYGVQVETNLGKTMLCNSLRGYYGYLNNGDKPLIYSLKLEKQNQSLDYGFYYQYGLNDFDYHNIGIGLKYHILSSKYLKNE